MDRYEFGEKMGELGEQLREGGVRKCINEHPKAVFVAAGVAAVVLAVSVAVWFGGGGPKRVAPLEKEWYYDLNTGKLFVGAKGLAVPTKSPSGPLPVGKPAGVRACVLSFKLEPGESERFIGFLETSDPNVKDDGGGKWAHGKLIRRVEDEKWVPADSGAGRAILEQAFLANANGEGPSYVRPK